MRFFLAITLVASRCLCFSQDLQQIDALLVDAKYQAAVESANVALSRPNDEKALLLNRKAEGLIQLGAFNEAETVLTSAEQSSRSPHEHAVTNTNYGLLYLNIGRNDLAQKRLEEALSLLDDQQYTTTLDRAKALSYAGQLYNVLGKTTQAQEQLQMALSIRQKLLPENHELIAAAYNDLGLSYVRVDNDKALDYYDKATAIYQSIHGVDHPKYAIANINTGFVYREMELYGDAVNNFETALKIWEKLFTTAHPAKAFALSNLGQTYLRMGDKKAARGYFDRSLKIYREVYGAKHPDIANILNLIGNLEIGNDNFVAALQAYQEALVANVKDFDNASVEANPALENYYNGKVLLYTLLFKAQAFEKKYFGQSLKLGELQLALKTLQQCDQLIDRLRQQTSNENDKLTLGAIANEVYGDGVRIAYQIAENSLAKKTYLHQAFYFSEKSKSAVLLEAISDSQAKSFAGIPPALIDEEKKLKAEIALVAQQLSQKPSVELEGRLREQSFTLNKTYNEFITSLEKQYPQYFNLKYNATTPSVSDLQNTIGDDAAVISYFIDEKNTKLYTFQITRTGFSVTDKSLPDKFDRYITGFRNALYFNDLKTYHQTSAILSRVLIPRLNAKIGRVLIIPTGRLGIIPFEALVTKDWDGADYRAIPYLIKKASVSYEFSSALLLQKLKGFHSTENKSIFLCAPVNFKEATQLPALPGTKNEVDAIAAMFKEKQLVADANIGNAATEERVKDFQISRYNFLHFATHGVVDETNPELSRIFLQSASTDDGNLYAGEIYNLQLNADLVTLSACQTGLGKISKGEGVIGLSRALVYAGAKNVIVSFWSVADESTAELMKDFYTQTLSRSPADTHYFHENLRQAKLKMIASRNFNAPYYWAPFIMIGY